jgi:hypothetical protein
MKIIGKFSKAEAEKAIDDYIEENRGKFIKPLLNKRDLQDKKLFTTETAFKKVRETLYEEYFKV